MVLEKDDLDSWDNEEDSVATPEDEDGEDVLGDLAPKASKKKTVKVDETKSKKEHVNVVFIGHVGE